VIWIELEHALVGLQGSLGIVDAIATQEANLQAATDLGPGILGQDHLALGNANRWLERTAGLVEASQLAVRFEIAGRDMGDEMLESLCCQVGGAETLFEEVGALERECRGLLRLVAGVD